MIFPMFVDFSEVSVAYATIVAKKGDIQHLLKSRRHHSKVKRFPIAEISQKLPRSARNCPAPLNWDALDQMFFLIPFFIGSFASERKFIRTPIRRTTLGCRSLPV
jgi:hypothetical protein